MEEGAPLNPSSGGTPTAMVAVPMLNTALGQQLSIFGGTGVGTKMEASIHLRAKDFAAHERWLANLADVITSNGLDDLWEGYYRHDHLRDRLYLCQLVQVESVDP